MTFSPASNLNFGEIDNFQSIAQYNKAAGDFASGLFMWLLRGGVIYWLWENDKSEFELRTMP